MVAFNNPRCCYPLCSANDQPALTPVQFQSPCINNHSLITPITLVLDRKDTLEMGRTWKELRQEKITAVRVWLQKNMLPLVGDLVFQRMFFQHFWNKSLQNASWMQHIQKPLLGLKVTFIPFCKARNVMICCWPLVEHELTWIKWHAWKFTVLVQATSHSSKYVKSVHKPLRCVLDKPVSCYVWVGTSKMDLET